MNRGYSGFYNGCFLRSSYEYVYAIQWSRENKEIVLATPLNKIKTTLQPLIDNIHALFGVKDFRVISRAVFEEDCGRKELLRFMKSMCDENIC